MSDPAEVDLLAIKFFCRFWHKTILKGTNILFSLGDVLLLRQLVLVLSWSAKYQLRVCTWDYSEIANKATWLVKDRQKCADVIKVWPLTSIYFAKRSQ